MTRKDSRACESAGGKASVCVGDKGGESTSTYTSMMRTDSDTAKHEEGSLRRWAFKGTTSQAAPVALSSLIPASWRSFTPNPGVPAQRSVSDAHPICPNMCSVDLAKSDVEVNNTRAEARKMLSAGKQTSRDSADLAQACPKRTSPVMAAPACRPHSDYRTFFGVASEPNEALHRVVQFCSNTSRMFARDLSGCRNF